MYNCVTCWLDETAARFPDKMAFADKSTSYTFFQVRQRALSIAYQIRAKLGAGKQPVAVYMDRSADMLVAYLGIAYSGNFYSPVATDMPPVRAGKILAVLKPAVAVCDQKYRDDCGTGKRFPFEGDILVYQDLCSIAYGEKEVEGMTETVVDTDLLYVLFTSGSTGDPKGVAVSHRSVLDYIDWVTETFWITEKDSFGNQAPFYFDNSILDIYSAVKCGAALYIIPEELFSQPVKLLEYLRDNGISTIFWVLSALIVVSRLRALKYVDLSHILKRVLFCGEVMPNKQLNIWRKYLPDVIYANLYGPTEITDACTCYIVDREFSDDEPLPIGKPMKNTDILVLKNDNTVVTGMEHGELCVRGTGVTAGYYNDPVRTAEAFVQNPLNHAYPEVIYKTGDIVYYNRYREQVYVCRKDFQIKHLGHRIELGEIETAVSAVDGVDSCCCLYDEVHKKIVLFLDRPLKRDYIIGQLARMVPDYMYPDKVVAMDCLPVNANGKIDRVRLKEFL